MKTLTFTESEDGKYEVVAKGFTQLEIIGIGEILAVRARLTLLKTQAPEPTPSDSSNSPSPPPSHTPSPA